MANPWLPVVTNLLWGVAVGLFCGVMLVWVRQLSRMLIAHLRWHAALDKEREAVMDQLAKDLDTTMEQFGFKRRMPGPPSATTN